MGPFRYEHFEFPPELLMDESEMTHLRIAMLLQILVLSRVGGAKFVPAFSGEGVALTIVL
jgi:hypothetical protein